MPTVPFDAPTSNRKGTTVRKDLEKASSMQDNPVPKRPMSRTLLRPAIPVCHDSVSSGSDGSKDLS